MAAKFAATTTRNGRLMNTHEITEPFFITEEIETEMIAAGYVFDVPTLVTLPHDYNKALEPEERSGYPTVSAE